MRASDWARRAPKLRPILSLVVASSESPITPVWKPLRAYWRTSGSSGADGVAGALSPPPSSARRPGGEEALGVRSSNSGGVASRRHRRLTPLEDGALCRVLVRFNLHHPFVFLKGRRSGWCLGDNKRDRDNRSGRSGGRRSSRGAWAPDAPLQRARAPTSLARFSSFNTIPLPKFRIQDVRK